MNEEKLRCAVEQSALGKLKQVARVAPHPEHLEDHPMTDVSGQWSHDDHKSPKWGCGTPSKWPFLWFVNGGDPNHLPGMLLQAVSTRMGKMHCGKLR